MWRPMTFFHAALAELLVMGQQDGTVLVRVDGQFVVHVLPEVGLISAPRLVATMDEHRANGGVDVLIEEEPQRSAA